MKEQCRRPAAKEDMRPNGKHLDLRVSARTRPLARHIGINTKEPLVVLEHVVARVERGEEDQRGEDAEDKKEVVLHMPELSPPQSLEKIQTPTLIP